MNYHNVSLQIFGRVMAGILAIALIASGSVSAQSESLRWKLKPGQAFDVVTTQNIKQSVETPFGNQEIPIEITIDMVWTVGEVNGEEFEIEQTINRFRMDMNAAMMQINVDTDDEAGGDPQAEMIVGPLRKMVRVPFKMTMNARGQILKFDVPEELKSNRGGAMGSGFTPDSLKQMASMTFFPENALSKGDTWTNEETVDSGMGKMTLSNTFTYQGTETVDGKQLSKIDIASDVKMGVMEDADVQMNFDEAEGSGTIYFDSAAGIPYKIVGSQKMSGELDAGGQKMGMKMTSQQETRISPKK